MKLKFHTSESIFYDRDGKLQEEPDVTLRTLERRYKKLCDEYCACVRRMREAEAPYTRTRWKNNVEPVFMESESPGYGQRTRENAEWSDITIAFALNFTSRGEKTTREAAGDKYVSVPLPQVINTCHMKETVASLASQMRDNPHFNERGIKLNIAGNGACTLWKCGLRDMGVVSYYVRSVIRALVDSGIIISEIRSGGQTGVDEAGILAAQDCGIRCSVLAPKGFRMRDKDGFDSWGREPFVARFREKYVDYDLWDKEDPEGCLMHGLCEFNGYNAIDMLEYEIDLKIMHLNSRKAPVN